MTVDASVAGYEFLGRVVDPEGATVGICFQLEPGLLVTAFHVLSKIGAAAEGDAVRIGPVAGGWLHAAVVVRTDGLHDLAVLRTQRPLPHPRLYLAASDAMRTAEDVKSAGYAEVEDNGHEYALLPAGGEWRGPMLRNGLLWARIQADAVMPGMSGAPVLRVSDGCVVGVVSARYRSQDEFMNGSVWVARVEDLIPLLDGLTQAAVNDLRGTDAAAADPAEQAFSAPRADDLGLPPVPPGLFALGMFSVAFVAAAAAIGFRYGDAPAAVIVSSLLVTSLLSIGGVVYRWLDRSSRSGIEMWALGTVLLLDTVNTGMMIPPDAPGRGMTVLIGVPAFWLAFPLSLRLFLGLPYGAPPGLAKRRLVTVAFWLGSVAGFVMLLTKTDVPACANWCGRSPVQLIDDPKLYLAIRSGLLAAMAVLIVVGIALLVRRFRDSSPVERLRSRQLLVLSASAALLYLAYSLAAVSYYFSRTRSAESWNDIGLLLGWLLGIGLPVYLLIILGRRPVMRFRLHNLAYHPLGGTLQGLERGIGSILKDPSFRIARQCEQAWRDASGSLIPSTGPAAQTPIPGYLPSVVLLHDPAYLGDRYLLDVVIRLVTARLRGLDRNSP